MLRENSFAVAIVGEVRDKKGNYYNFVSDTISAFLSAGLKYYNEIILKMPIGSGALRANRIFGSMRKVIKVHQNVLVFLKGDARKIKLEECKYFDVENEE